jgi:hypothetical protein
MLANVAHAIPLAEEYKNDLVQPDFLGITSVPKSHSSAIAVQSPTDPDSPILPEQWAKVDKMVAWLRASFVYYM